MARSDLLSGAVVSSRPRAHGLAAHGDPKSFGALAQSVEHRTFNPLVDGSIPSRPKIKLVKTIV
jgi:hypothetical protein